MLKKALAVASMVLAFGVVVPTSSAWAGGGHHRYRNHPYARHYRAYPAPRYDRDCRGGRAGWWSWGPPARYDRYHRRSWWGDGDHDDWSPRRYRGW